MLILKVLEAGPGRQDVFCYRTVSIPELNNENMAPSMEGRLPGVQMATAPG